MTLFLSCDCGVSFILYSVYHIVLRWLLGYVSIEGVSQQLDPLFALT